MLSCVGDSCLNDSLPWYSLMVSSRVFTAKRIATCSDCTVGWPARAATIVMVVALKQASRATTTPDGDRCYIRWKLSESPRGPLTRTKP